VLAGCRQHRGAAPDRALLLLLTDPGAEQHGAPDRQGENGEQASQRSGIPHASGQRCDEDTANHRQRQREQQKTGPPPAGHRGLQQQEYADEGGGAIRQGPGNIGPLDGGVPEYRSMVLIRHRQGREARPHLVDR